MRYRRLTPEGDFAFGHGQADYLVDSPACVTQAILTRLRLIQGEWWLDLTEGTPYRAQVLGKNSALTAGLALRKRVLGTPGVAQIDDWTSTRDAQRNLAVRGVVTTTFGRTPFTAELVTP